MLALPFSVSAAANNEAAASMAKVSIPGSSGLYEGGFENGAASWISQAARNPLLIGISFLRARMKRNQAVLQ
jgi:hypothetical protein